MKMRKMALTLTCLLLVTALSACGDTNKKHSHAATGDWYANATEHWHQCQCGQKLDVEKHTLTDDVCTVCKSEVVTVDENLTYLYTYSRYGDLTSNIIYDADGGILSEMRMDIAYDAKGNKLQETSYEDGAMVWESRYEVVDGESRQISHASYNSDGSRVVNEYDANGNVSSVMEYNAEGNTVMEGHYHYEQDKNGDFYEAYAEEKFHESEISIRASYNEYGDITHREVYDINGTKVQENRYEREYNADGKPLWEKDYLNDKLIYEIVSYAVTHVNDVTIRYPEKTIDYYEDDTKLISEFGSNAEIAKETYYTSAGTVERTVTYSYETDENGLWTSIKSFENGRLSSLAEYTYNDDGMHYKNRYTQYFTDGSKSVFEYDEYENLLSAEIYDASGNKI